MDVTGYVEAVKALQREAGARGWVAPAFRSPPRDPRATRALRRLPNGAVLVAVAIRQRSDDEVARDLAAGLLAANERPIEGSEAEYLAAVALDAARAVITA